MSHYTEVKTIFKDRYCLVKALEAVYGKGSVEIHTQGAALIGYRGDDRSKTSGANYAPPCNVIVRRQKIGQASNDIGFRWNDGRFDAYVSEYDAGAFKNKGLEQKYATLVVKKQAAILGYTVQETKEQNGVTHLKLQQY